MLARATVLGLVGSKGSRDRLGGRPRTCDGAKSMRTGAQPVTWTISDATIATPPLSLQYSAPEESSAASSAKPASAPAAAEASNHRG